MLSDVDDNVLPVRVHPGDGTMDLEELSTVFVSLGAELKDRELQKVMNEMVRKSCVPDRFAK